MFVKKMLLFIFLCLTLVACDFGGANQGENNGEVVPTEVTKPAPTPTTPKEEVVTPTPTIPKEEITPTIPEEEHKHVYLEEWKYDNDSHWNECECGQIEKKVPHVIKEIVTAPSCETFGSKEYSCVCGYSYSLEILPKEHEYASKWSSDEVGHWHECLCGDKKDYAAHIGGEATEELQATCEVCGTPYGNLKEVVTELSAPVLLVDEETGEVSWEEVAGATHYNYIINGGELQTTLQSSIILSNKSNIVVQAANNNTISSFSNVVAFYDVRDIVLEEKQVYVYFHNTDLAPILVNTGDKITRPEGLNKENYIFDDFYEDPFYKTKFDFNNPIEKTTIIYANWTPTNLIKGTYFWVKGSSKMTSSIMSSETTSGWHFIPLKVNEGQINFKEYYVTVTVSGATTADPCYFIVMDGFDNEPGRTYWKKADETDFTIKSDGTYNIYFSVEHEYAAKVHISVGLAVNTAATLSLNYEENLLETPVVSVDREENKATWQEVSGATKYEVVINNGEVMTVTTNSVDLPVRSHISVRALSDTKESKWSVPKANLTYDEEVDEKDPIYVYFKGFESMEIDKNSYVIKPEDPRLDGFTFGGWYYDIACTKPVSFPVQLTENTVFYPKWNLNGNYTTDIYYNLVTSTGTVVKGLVWNFDNYTYDEYETGIVALKANTTYYIESLDKAQKWGPYIVSESADYKVYFSPDYYWDRETPTERNAYFAKQVYEIAVYFSNNKHWSGTIKAYIWNSSTNKPLASWPGTAMEKVKTNEYGEDIYKVVVDLSLYDCIIFTNGTNQTVDISLKDVVSGTGYYISSGKNVSTYKYE